MIRWAVSRPAVIWASVLIVLVAGAVSFSRLALATKTTVELPQLSVFASWGGASAELMEMYVTAPMEGAVQGIRGVRRTSSESGEGSASVTLKLDPKADVQMTRLAILERLEMAVSDSAFPPNVRPSVSNYVPDELRDQPLLRFTVIGQYSPPTLQRIINEQVVTRISAIPGVGNVSLSGSVRSGASVVYDPLLLRQLNIEPTVLGTALSSARQVRVLGDEELGASVRHVVLRDEPKALEDLEDLPIRAGNGLRSRTFRLSELSTITPSMEDGGNFIRIDGDPAMPLSISREAGADAIKTASAVLATLEEIRPSLPASVRLKITNDDSKQLREKLRDLVKRGLVAFGAVLVVMLLVLRNLRGTLLVMGSAAVAIAGTAFGLYVFKIPANLLTLAGLGMGIGILVQNGLIVLDGLGRAPDTIDGRARAGTTIFPAVLGATLTTVVVLFPFLYLQGDARAAFMPFAAAFALALGWSVIASVLMIPSVGTGHGMHVRRWRRLQHAYAWSMRGLLRWRWATVLITIVAISGLSWVFYKRVPRYSWGGGFGGNPTYISVNVTFPRGSDPETPANTIKEFEQMALRRPGVQQVYVSGSSRSANMRIDFTPEAEQTSIPVEMLDAMTQRAVMVGGASIGVHGIGPGFSSGGGGGGYGGSFRVKILGYSYRGVGAIAEDLKDRLEVIPRVRDVRITSASFYGSDRSFMATLQPDRQALARFGLSTQQFAAAVGREIRGSIGGGTSVSIAGEEIQVSLKSKGTRDRTLEELRQVIIPGAIGRTAVRIGDVALVGEREALSSVSREDQQYVRILTYDFRGPGKLAQRTHKAFMASTTVPLGYVVSDERFSFERDDSAKGLWLVFGIGVTLVVLAVAIVFDSVWAAAMVFLSLPIALAGVAAAFWLAKAAFTREAAVGVVLVVGLAVNQVILVVDAALAHRRRNAARFGRPFIRVSDAFRAALERSGTIMLVTLTTLASLIPLAYHTKVTDLFGSIALATAGGTVAGTIGAMFIMPPIMALTLHRRPRRTPAVAPLPVVAPAVPS